MEAITTITAAILALIILPVLILLWATESPQQRARRMRAAGQSCKDIGARLGVSHQQVSFWCRA